MRYLSVCSGIEAATQAWHPIGWQPVAFSEIDPFPSAVLDHHYPDVPNWGDMTKFKEWPNDPDVNVLVGGTPCQSFSVAGLRKGLDDPRGNLALTYLAIAELYRPEWLVWENVPGVLSSGGGRDFGSFLGALVKLGYGFAYRVLDAQYVRTRRFRRAVPQRRRRVFVVGSLGGWQRAAAVLFDAQSLLGNPPPSRRAWEEVAAPLVSSAPNGSPAKGARSGTAKETNLIPIAFGGNNTRGPIEAATARNAHGGPCGRLDFESETFLVQPVAAPLDASFARLQGCSVQDMRCGHSHLVPAIAFNWANGGGYGEANDGLGIGVEQAGPCSVSQVQAVAFDTTQITNKDNRSNPQPGGGRTQERNILTPTMAVRRLTPRECERLQGFPDDFTRIPWRKKGPDRCPDGPRYKALGNSMAVNAMAFIGRRIQMVSEILGD